MAACSAFRSLRPESSSYAVIKVLVKPNVNVCGFGLKSWMPIITVSRIAATEAANLGSSRDHFTAVWTMHRFLASKILVAGVFRHFY
jgi:hypothetical protein